MFLNKDQREKGKTTLICLRPNCRHRTCPLRRRQLPLLLLLQGFLRAPRRRPSLRMFQRPLPGARASVQATFMVRVQGLGV
jgi:hypothetical protein